MKRAITLVALLAGACAAPDPAAGYETSSLPIAEANAARAALAQADLVITTDDGRTFLGATGLGVAFGPDGHDVSLAFYTHELTTTMSIPPDLAGTLATDGWDFTVASAGRLDGDLRGDLASIEIRADADGLFFATLHAIDVDGADRVLTATGRMSTGVCTLWTGGAPTAPADIDTCRAVIAALRPPTDRPPLGPTR